MTREKAIITLEHYLDYWKMISDEEAFPIDDDIEALQIAIKALQEQKTGKWIGGELGFCTRCGHEGCASDIWDRCTYTFCPNCGAYLEVEGIS